MTIHRRDLLAGAGLCLAGVWAGTTAWAQEQPAVQRFRSILVDTRPYASLGAGGTARAIQQIMPGKLRDVFADRLAPGDTRAPNLVARIDHLFLSSYADAPSPGFDSFSSTDSIDGAGLVVAGNRTLSITPLRASLPAGYSGAYYLPDIDARRVDSLCQQFAYWLRREMNL